MFFFVYLFFGKSDWPSCFVFGQLWFSPFNSSMGAIYTQFLSQWSANFVAVLSSICSASDTLGHFSTSWKFSFKLHGCSMFCPFADCGSYCDLLEFKTLRLSLSTLRIRFSVLSQTSCDWGWSSCVQISETYVPLRIRHYGGHRAATETACLKKVFNRKSWFNNRQWWGISSSLKVVSVCIYFMRACQKMACSINMLLYLINMSRACFPTQPLLKQLICFAKKKKKVSKHGMNKLKVHLVLIRNTLMEKEKQTAVVGRGLFS